MKRDKRTLIAFLAPISLGLLFGCSSGSSETPSGSAGAGGGIGGSGGGASSSLYGNVAVILKEAEGYTDFAAVFRDGPPPPPSDTGARGVSMMQGGCQLLVPVSCTPACDAASWCTGTNQCTPKSATLQKGTLRVQGLSSGELTLAQEEGYTPVPTLPFPACDEGDAVTVQADAFTVSAKCIAPLHVTTAQPVPVKAGQATNLAWTAPAQSNASRVLITVEISHHGGYQGQIDCDVPDTGTFSIPEPLVTALYNRGRHGFPTVTLTRVSAGTAPTQSNVKLQISSEVALTADTGVLSCNGAAECTAPKTCQSDRTCQ